MESLGLAVFVADMAISIVLAATICGSGAAYDGKIVVSTSISVWTFRVEAIHFVYVSFDQENIHPDIFSRLSRCNIRI